MSTSNSCSATSRETCAIRDHVLSLVSDLAISGEPRLCSGRGHTNLGFLAIFLRNPNEIEKRSVGDTSVVPCDLDQLMVIVEYLKQHTICC